MQRNTQKCRLSKGAIRSKCHHCNIQEGRNSRLTPFNWILHFIRCLLLSPLDSLILQSFKSTQHKQRLVGPCSNNMAPFLTSRANEQYLSCGSMALQITLPINITVLIILRGPGYSHPGLQDWGPAHPGKPWEGLWHLVLVSAPSRSGWHAMDLLFPSHLRALYWH